MLTLKLAIRNMLAHGQRTRILLIVVGLVSCVVFLLLSFSDGQLDNLGSGVLVLNDPSSDLVVLGSGLKTGYEQGEEWKHLSAHSIRQYPALLEELKKLPFVQRVAAPTTGFTLNIVAAGKRHENFFLRGVDPGNSWLVSDHLTMREGAFFDSLDRPEIILHYKTAPTVNVRPGETVRLTGKDLFGQVVVQDVVMRGYFMGKQDLPSLGEIGFMNMSAYRLVSGLAPDETMSILVETQKSENKISALKSLRLWVRDRHLPVESWEFNEVPKLSLRTDDLARTYGLFRIILQATGLIVLGVVAFGIMNIVSVNLYDRKREIGTYYCLGSERKFLIGLYTLEIVIVNLLATFGGLLAGLVIRLIINGMDISTDESGLQLVFGGSNFTLGFTPDSVVFIISSITIVTLLTALFTLGSRLNVAPVAALREGE